MSVADDFSAFNDACKIPTDKISSIAYRYQRITRQLNRDFWTTESETAHSLYTGSYGRDTAAKGISDLDIGFVLPFAVYKQYNAYQGNGQSALLQAVKRSMQNTYPTSEIAGDGQVVVIRFDDNITFEVLPVFENDDGSSWTYPNANAGGSWRVCNPRAEIAAVAARNQGANRNLKRMCRMARVWRDYCSVPLSGMLIDTLAYQFIERYQHRDKSFLYYALPFRDFCGYLAGQDQKQTVWRAPGSASYVNRTGTFEYKARTAELRAIEAIVDDQAGREWSRRQKWRDVFGSTFPG
jgi:Second Messenger Oligonucleotide or Dinucleotide Synthetase domain